MRVANCKIFCREIEEADQGQSLTSSALKHLSACGQCQRFYDERMKLRQLVASLGTVAAPADFELKVRSRLSNDGVGARSGVFFRSFAFGFPSLAVATLLLVVGGLVGLRLWNAPDPNEVRVHKGSPEAGGTGLERIPASSSETSITRVAEPRGLDIAKASAGKGVQRHSQVKKRSLSRSAFAAVRNRRSLATREFSSTGAPLVKSEEAVASLGSPIFMIETSSQPLRLSLDYSGGVSRTISVPALSFGSEGVITGGSSSVGKNWPKGAW
jgi:hypothetical protein